MALTVSDVISISLMVSHIILNGANGISRELLNSTNGIRYHESRYFLNGTHGISRDLSLHSESSVNSCMHSVKPGESLTSC